MFEYTEEFLLPFESLKNLETSSTVQNITSKLPRSDSEQRLTVQIEC